MRWGGWVINANFIIFNANKNGESWRLVKSQIPRKSKLPNSKSGFFFFGFEFWGFLGILYYLDLYFISIHHFPIILRKLGEEPIVLTNYYANQTVEVDINGELRFYREESKETTSDHSTILLYSLIIIIIILVILLIILYFKTCRANETKTKAHKKTVNKKSKPSKPKKSKVKAVEKSSPKKAKPKSKTTGFCGYCGEAVDTPFCQHCGREV